MVLLLLLVHDSKGSVKGSSVPNSGEMSPMKRHIYAADGRLSGAGLVNLTGQARKMKGEGRSHCQRLGQAIFGTSSATSLCKDSG